MIETPIRAVACDTTTCPRASANTPKSGASARIHAANSAAPFDRLGDAENACANLEEIRKEATLSGKREHASVLSEQPPGDHDAKALFQGRDLPDVCP